jgi:hypothetical protein
MLPSTATRSGRGGVVRFFARGSSSDIGEILKC